MSSKADLPDQDWLIIGKIVAPQGLKGELRINPSSDFPERFTKPGKRWLQFSKDSPHPIELIKGRQIPGKAIYIVQFAEVNDRSTAEKLIGANLLILASNRPSLKENEFHFLDLLGLEAKLTREGRSIGKVTNLTQAGNDLIEIELTEGRKVLVPFVKSIVPEVQIKEGWLLITPPPGLLEL